MYSIGAFAQLGGVSVRMLRHYDRIGLLVPAEVDPSTGRRRYDANQLTRLNRLVALKHLGFPLEQVRTLLADGMTSSSSEECCVCAQPIWKRNYFEMDRPSTVCAHGCG